MIRNAARAGIPGVKYNLTFLGVPRTDADRRAAGGADYSTFVYDRGEAGAAAHRGRAGRRRRLLGADHLLPRAGRAGGGGIQGARWRCHPQDPAMPQGKGWRGVETVLGSVDGLKRFIAIKESPYHGLNFCQGTVSEMLEKPGEEIFDVIRYFGIAQQDLQRALPQHRRRLPELPRDVHRRRRRRHAEGDARLQGGRLRRDDDAGPRAADRGRRRRASRRSRSRSATSRR